MQRQAFVDLLDTTDRSLEQDRVADRILTDTLARLGEVELPELPPPGPYSGGKLREKKGSKNGGRQKKG